MFRRIAENLGFLPDGSGGDEVKHKHHERFLETILEQIFQITKEF